MHLQQMIIIISGLIVTILTRYDNFHLNLYFIIKIKRMSKQYCFDIENPIGVEFDINELKKFVEKLYIGSKKDQFTEDEKIPFVTIHAKADDSICILMTSKGKKNVERVESINRRLKSNNLKWKDDITLTEPYEFDVDAQAWWGGDSKTSKVKGKRWTTLEHRGPYFTHLIEPCKSIGGSLIYEGKTYQLTPIEEKIASFYAKRKISEASGGVVEELTKDKVFNNNYWTDFKTYLTKEHKAIFKDFSKIGWENLIASIESDKESVMSATEKLAKKTRNEERKREYGYAVLDGHREKVGNFTVEPASIFYGRGANPNRGKVKGDINPEDVTINIGSKTKIPEPPSGHKWGKIIHDQNAAWLAKWTDSITGDTKYVMFSAEGRFKGESDLVKYEKARKLEMHIEKVRENYMVDASSQNSIKMQLGTVLYLIDHFGVRVGNERKSDEADTVGASTLRVDHVKLKSPDHVIFDFLGKDSIRFYKDLEVPTLIYNNFEKLVKGKKKAEQVFNSISSRSINAYLKEFDKSFSAKVFRTRLASKIMYDALKDVKIPKDSTKAKTKVLFNKANAKVADVLNHTRNVSKKAKDAVKKDEEKLKELKKELNDRKKDGKNIDAIEKRIETAKNRIESKTDVMTVAINTSLTNYIDPRLVVSWSKKQKADLTAIYTSTLMRKFQWAVETTESDWDWMHSPLIGNPELEPLEGEETAVQISGEDKPPKKKHVKSTKPSKRSKRRKSITPRVSKHRKISYIGPGSVADYNLLLNICKDPEKYKFKLINIPRNVMEWIYHFSKYAIDNGGSMKANEYIVNFYNMAYVKKV